MQFNIHNWKFSRAVTFSTALVGAMGLWGCGQKKSLNNTPSGSSKQEASKILYQCPMHHQIVRNHPGTCPICGMTLVPIGDNEASGDGGDGGGGDSLGHSHSASSTLSSPGSLSSSEVSPIVRIDPAVVQNIGVRTEILQRRRLSAEIRLDGRVTADESRIRSVTARVAGYVEKLHASVSGQTVRQGESLLELYSPDLVSAQEELVQALRYRDESPRAASDSESTSSQMEEQEEDKEGEKDATDLVQSARSRLRNWGMAESFVNALEKTRQVERQVPIASPITGVLIRKNVIEGQNVTPGMEMFQIADLSQVWVTAQIYQEDLATVKIGSRVTLNLRNLPGHDLSGRVSFISPELDPVTRTAEIRIEVLNTPALDLRPEMFAGVVVQGVSDSVLAVPEEALIRSGTRTIAVVALGDGRFQPREVRIGRSAEGYVEILDGLREGDNIVVSAQFLLDSESNLRAVVEQLTASFGSENTGNTDADKGADTSTYTNKTSVGNHVQ